MHDTMRAFVAINLDIAASRRVAEFMRRARGLSSAPRAAWVPPTRLHVTLRFLGDIDPGLGPAIGDLMRKALASRPAPRLSLGPVGAFPRLEAARVVFLHIDDEARALEQMARELDEGLGEMGMEGPTFPFVPHLTLARCRETPSLKSFVAELGPAALGPAIGAECVLYRSEAVRTGAEYTALERVALLPADRSGRPSQAARGSGSPGERGPVRSPAPRAGLLPAIPVGPRLPAPAQKPGDEPTGPAGEPGAGPKGTR